MNAENAGMEKAAPENTVRKMPDWKTRDWKIRAEKMWQALNG